MVFYKFLKLQYQLKNYFFSVIKKIAFFYAKIFYAKNFFMPKNAFLHQQTFLRKNFFTPKRFIANIVSQFNWANYPIFCCFFRDYANNIYFLLFLFQNK